MLPTGVGNTRNSAVVTLLPKANAAHFKLAQITMRATADFAAIVLTRRKLRLFAPFFNHGFLCHVSSPLCLCLKRNAQQFQKLVSLFVGMRRRHNNNVHAANLVDFIVLDFGENELLF